jgi:hypothetical protein
MADDLEFLASIDGFRLRQVKVAKDTYVSVYNFTVSVPKESIKDANRLIGLCQQGCYLTMSEAQSGLELGK